MHTHLRTVRTALVALRRNIMRSALTCLGIIIGIAAVIAMMEIGTGAQALIHKSIASMGANTLLVLPGTAASGGISWGSGSVMTLTPEDNDAIIRECPSVKYSCPIVRAKSSQVVFGSKNWIPQQIQGTTPAFLDIRDWADMADGADFTDQDVRNTSKVCVIGKTLVRELFDGASPVGKEVRIANVTFRVVGVLRSKGANMMGSDQDDIVIAPWTTIKFRLSGQSFGGAAQASSVSAGAGTDSVNSLSNLYPTASGGLYPAMSSIQKADTPQPVRFTNVDQLLCAATSDKTIKSATKEITAALHDRHHIHGDEPDDFQLRDMGELMKMMTATTGTMTGLLLSVAAISLVVGGVGIMNIMLVSVTERTREIGLRMAVGARAWDILLQFLVEAVLLCLLGGALGITLGRGTSVLIRMLVHMPTEVSIPAIVASVVVSAAVGLIFGFYPAFKASRLDPIEALRYE